MDRKNLIGLVIVLIIGLIAAFGTYSMLTQSENTYLVAGKPIRAGDMIDPNALKQVTVRGEIPEAVPVSMLESLSGQRALVSIPENALLTKKALSGEAGTNIDQTLPQGMVAYTVQADNVTGVSPRLHEGNFVNIYASWSYTPSGGGEAIPVSLQVNPKPFRVLDVQLDTTQNNPALAGVTLEVPVELVTTIDFFQNFGKIHLAQVSPDEQTQAIILTGPNVAKQLKLQ